MTIHPETQTISGESCYPFIRQQDGGLRPRLGTCSSQHLNFATQFCDLHDRSARHFHHYCPVDTWRPQIVKEPWIVAVVEPKFIGVTGFEELLFREV